MVASWTLKVSNSYCHTLTLSHMSLTGIVTVLCIIKYPLGNCSIFYTYASTTWITMLDGSYLPTYMVLRKIMDYFLGGDF